MTEATRVLSIQSHVVHGYVGNKCAVFPLQLHGFDVDFINSVQLSNHTEYGHFKGDVLNHTRLADIFAGLQTNDLHHYTHVLTGYCSDASFLTEVARIIPQFRKINPDMFYVCDPVMGDCGEYYVDKALMPIYRDNVIPFADVVTPNQFELQELTGIPINTESDCLTAMNVLHNAGPEIVVVSSSDISENPAVMHGYASRRSGGRQEIFRFDIDRFPVDFVGSGDLFATSLIIWLHKTRKDLKESITRTLATMHDILGETLKYAWSKTPAGEKPSFKNLELRIIQNQCKLLQPSLYQARITDL